MIVAYRYTKERAERTISAFWCFFFFNFFIHFIGRWIQYCEAWEQRTENNKPKLCEIIYEQNFVFDQLIDNTIHHSGMEKKRFYFLFYITFDIMNITYSRMILFPNQTKFKYAHLFIRPKKINRQSYRFVRNTSKIYEFLNEPKLLTACVSIQHTHNMDDRFIYKYAISICQNEPNFPKIHLFRFSTIDGNE